ncbi:sigma 54-interacting transcriptional regulator [Duganella sp. Dugasp56]|uniref:sigma-54-dependent transcriptional regulator n=1 Tax=Duganella sp. Dugasp56 TaxID=3243046 RepID=UPI00159E4975
MTTPVSTLRAQDGPWLGLTILWHPERERIGQQCLAPDGSAPFELHRYLPLFRHPGQEGAGLGHRCIARAPLRLQRHADRSVTLALPDSRMAVGVNGVLQTRPVLQLDQEQITRGVVLSLGGMVLLCLHWMRGLPQRNPLPGILGVSDAAVALRAQIRQVARTELPVLLLGETGTGKDLAARAIHAGSDRKTRPFVAVNMAALSESLAAADLFGAAKGAYTGAQQARGGLFAEAGDGTLFLDEIGDTPAPVQPMLLRVLENGEYRPLGARQTLLSQARLIAATDRDLGGQGFNQALRRRLEAFVIDLPPLRARREDIGVLLAEALAQWSAQSGQAVDLPPALVGQLCLEDWPGNIRQLAHVARRAAMAVAAGDTPVLAALLPPPDAPREAGLASPARPARANLAELTAPQIAAAMARNGWQIQAAARDLGISRPSLYKLLQRHPEIRRPGAV